MNLTEEKCASFNSTKKKDGNKNKPVLGMIDED